MLILFPNTFEYIFIWYEAIRARWNPAKISRKFWILSAAAIWIFIKLPQEYIIHIAQVDISEFINTEIFGVPAHYTFIEACIQEPGIALMLAAIATAIVLLALHFFRTHAPKPDWKLRLKADQITARAPEQQALLSRHLLEKVIMTGLIAVIFAHVVPAGELSDVQLFFAAAFLALVNGPVGYWMAVKFRLMRSFMRQFLLMAVVNMLFAYLYIALLPDFSESVAFHSIFFFAALLTFLGITFDRYAVVQRKA